MGNVAYTWSKCLDNASATISTEQGQWAIYDAYNPTWIKVLAALTPTRCLPPMPFIGCRSKAIGRWTAGNSVLSPPAIPACRLTSRTNLEASLNPEPWGATEGERPNLVPGCNPMARKRNQWWNPQCFVFAPYGTLGNSSRNALNNPDYFNLDFSIVKNTKLTEKVSLQFRAEFFDVLNHPNFFYGSQTYLMGTAGMLPPRSKILSQNGEYESTLLTPLGSGCLYAPTG